jgi:hypothetical protein
MAETRNPDEINRGYGRSTDMPNATLIPSGKDGADGGGSYGFSHRDRPIMSVVDPDVPGGGQVLMTYPDGRTVEVQVDDIKKAVVTPASGQEPVVTEMSSAPSIAEASVTGNSDGMHPDVVETSQSVETRVPVATGEQQEPQKVVFTPTPPLISYEPPKLRVTFVGNFGTIKSKFHDYVDEDDFVVLVYRCEDAEDELDYEPAVSPTASLSLSIKGTNIKDITVRHLGVVISLAKDGMILLVLFKIPDDPQPELGDEL